MRLERYPLPADIADGAKLIKVRHGATLVGAFLEGNEIALYSSGSNTATQPQDRFFHVTAIGVDVSCSPAKEPVLVSVVQAGSVKVACWEVWPTVG